MSLPRAGMASQTYMGHAQNNTHHANDRGADSALRVKAALIERYGIGAETIDQATLSRIVGINPKTLLGLARRGELPITTRRLGRSVLFLLDDVVDWLTPAPEPSIGWNSASPPNDSKHGVEVLPLDLDASIVEHESIARPETPQQRIDRISRQVIAKMHRERRKA
jgi:hypothetical protein